MKTLQLRITVTYNENETPLLVLQDMLTSIAQRAAGDGLMAGETAATVETWDSEVIEIKE